MTDDGYQICIFTVPRFGVLYAERVDVIIEMSADLKRGWNFAHFSIVYVDVTAYLLRAENRSPKVDQWTKNLLEKHIIAEHTFLYMRGSTCSATSTRSVWLMQRISLPTQCYSTVSLRLSYQLRNSAHPGRKAICICVCESVFSGLVV